MRTPRSIRERAIFVDTSAFYAFLNRKDRWHGTARQHFAQLSREQPELYTSNLVVAETYTLVRTTLGHSAAIRWLDSLDLNVIYETDHDHHDVCALLVQYDDKGFSYTDAASFVLMERLGIPTAFTFDDHFRQYGLATLP